MAAISATQMTEATDKLGAYWLAVVGTDASGYGLGTSDSTAGGWVKSEEFESLIASYQDWDLSSRLGGAARSLKTNSDARVAVGMLAVGMLGALNSVAAAAAIGGVADLDSFATNYNLSATPKWQCLLAPSFGELFAAIGTTTLTATNFYYEILQDGSNNAMGKLVVPSTFTLGDSIDSASYAGGFGQVKAVGITTVGSVSVNGTWRKTDGTTASGAGTATIAATGDSTVVLTPPFTDALLISVSGMSSSGGLAGGTVYAEAAAPAGRSNPPT